MSADIVLDERTLTDQAIGETHGTVDDGRLWHLFALEHLDSLLAANGEPTRTVTVWIDGENAGTFGALFDIAADGVYQAGAVGAVALVEAAQLKNAAEAFDRAPFVDSITVWIAEQIEGALAAAAAHAAGCLQVMRALEGGDIE